jgi:hypothetical protein
LWAELCQYPADTELETRVYEFYINSERRVLPRAGGYLDQPGALIDAIERIEQKYALVAKMEEIDEAGRKQIEALEQLPENTNDRSGSY